MRSAVSDAVGDAVGSANPAAQASLADNEPPARAPARHNLQASCQICEVTQDAIHEIPGHDAVGDTVGDETSRRRRQRCGQRRSGLASQSRRRRAAGSRTGPSQLATLVSDLRMPCPCF